MTEYPKREPRRGVATICPTEALTFGKRKTLLKIAKKRLTENPGKYIDHVYGEKEVGGNLLALHLICSL